MTLLRWPLLGSSGVLSSGLVFQQEVQGLFNQNVGAVVRVVSFVRQEDVITTRIGTGFFVQRDGLIVTTGSAVNDAQEMLVEHGEQSYAAELVGVDVITNLALLRLKNVEEQKVFPTLDLGDSSGLVSPGTFLLAISCKSGLSPSPVLTLAASLDGHHRDAYFATTYLRADWVSTGGEPGAPVFSMNGDFVGMLAAAVPEIQASFILPARAIRRVVMPLLASGKVRYAYMGVRTRLERSMSGEYRVLIDRLETGSPAEKAGLQPNDRILSIGNWPLKNLEALHDAVFFAEPDATVEFKILRRNQQLRISVPATSQTYPLGD